MRDPIGSDIGMENTESTSRLSIFGENQGGASDGFRPSVPKNLAETGLTEAYLIDLLIKHLYNSGMMVGFDLAKLVCLPFAIIDHLLDDVVNRAYVEKRGGEGLGNVRTRFILTDRGRAYTRDILEKDAYCGPAPVPMEQYYKYIFNQNLQSLKVSEDKLREAWRGFVLDDHLFKQLGPAISSGKSLILYGPSGTGKTTIAKMIARFLDKDCGHVSIPYALFAGNAEIQLYDPVYHDMVADDDNLPRVDWMNASSGDQRWLLCHRPAVIVGGELTLDMLDLRYNTANRYYEAPLQLKANGGVFVIDDFGRQLIPTQDLRNRWIVPLEERHDYLTMHTGQKFSIPLEQLVVFATNAKPGTLFDDAFLRRIRYKIFVGEPSIEAYKMIFKMECRKKDLFYNPDDLERIINKYYKEQHRLIRACDPRDITDRMLDDILFNSQTREINFERMDHHFADYLTDLKTAGVN